MRGAEKIHLRSHGEHHCQVWLAIDSGPEADLARVCLGRDRLFDLRQPKRAIEEITVLILEAGLAWLQEQSPAHGQT